MAHNLGLTMLSSPEAVTDEAIAIHQENLARSRFNSHGVRISPQRPVGRPIDLPKEIGKLCKIIGPIACQTIGMRLAVELACKAHQAIDANAFGY